jgi:hypothetical protein
MIEAVKDGHLMIPVGHAMSLEDEGLSIPRQEHHPGECVGRREPGDECREASGHLGVVRGSDLPRSHAAGAGSRVEPDDPVGRLRLDHHQEAIHLARQRVVERHPRLAIAGRDRSLQGQALAPGVQARQATHDGIGPDGLLKRQRERLADEALQDRGGAIVDGTDQRLQARPGSGLTSGLGRDRPGSDEGGSRRQRDEAGDTGNVHTSR